MCKGNQRIIDSVNRVNHDAIQRAHHSAMRMLLQSGVDEESAKRLIDSTIEYIPSIQKSSRKYIEGVVRWHCEGQVDLTDEHDLSRLDLFLRAFKGSLASTEYDRNFCCDGKPATFDMLCKLCYLDIDSTYEGVEELAGHDYKVVQIKSFKECKAYASYAPLWCIFQDEVSFRDYTADGENKLYLVLRDDYKEVPAKPGINTPRDAYGVSMICVIMNPANQIVVVTSRWNTDGEGERFLSNAELEELIGKKVMSELFHTGEFS